MSETGAPSFGMSQPGAVAAAARPTIPEHYGDPSAEQRALTLGCGLVDLGDYEVVAVSGSDRLQWLTTLSSQVLTDLPAQPLAPADRAGGAREALLLDYNGKIQHAFAVVNTADTAFLLVEPGCAGPLVEFLRSMIFASRVQVSDVSQSWQTFGIVAEGPIAAAIDAYQDALAALPEVAGCEPVPSSTAPQLLRWVDPWPGVTPGGTSYSDAAVRPRPVLPTELILLPRHAAVTADFPAQIMTAANGIIAATPAGELTDAAGYPVRETRWAGLAAWEAVRVANWRPSFTHEVDNRSLPHEYDWLRTAVHLQKGCYCGQETVARIVNLGRPPRRLVQLDCDGDSLPPKPGDAVVVSQGERSKQVGSVTSVARHYEDGVIALALVARSLPAGQISVNDQPVVVTAIVSEDGKAAASPATRPGAGMKRLPLQPGTRPSFRPEES